MWNSLDAEIQCEYGQIHKSIDNFYCDVCEKDLTCPFYRWLPERYDFCAVCITRKIPYTILIVGDSIELKTCLFCNSELRDDEWLWFVYGSYVKYEVCNRCISIDSEDALEEFHRKKEAYQIRTIDNTTHKLVGDGLSPIIVDFSPISTRIVPEYFREKITQEHIETWVKLIPDIAYLVWNFGSVRQWALFTSIYEVPYCVSKTFLLVDCSEKTNGRIASGVISQNSLQVAIVILYETVEEYIEAFNKWQENLPSIEEREKIEQKLDKLVFYDCKDVSRFCEEFSGYIRSKCLDECTGKLDF